jgi:hypothetical protein
MTIPPINSMNAKSSIPSVQDGAANRKADEEDNSKKAAPALTEEGAARALRKCQDTLQSIQGSIDGIEGVDTSTKTTLRTFASTVNGILRFATESIQVNNGKINDREERLNEALSQRPKIVHPSHEATKAMEDMARFAMKQQDDLQANIQDAKTQLQIEEKKINILRQVFAAFTKQTQLSEKDNEISLSIMEQKREHNKTLMDEYLDTKMDAARKKETASIFSWIGFGSGLLSVIMAVGGAIASFVSAGAALPAVIAAGTGLAQVAKGSSDIAQGVLKHQSEKSQAIAFGAKQEHTLNADTIQKELDRLEFNDNAMQSIWNNMVQILQNMPNMFKKG